MNTGWLIAGVVTALAGLMLVLFPRRCIRIITSPKMPTFIRNFSASGWRPPEVGPRTPVAMRGLGLLYLFTAGCFIAESLRGR